MSDLIFDLEMLVGQVKPITLQVRDLQEGEAVTSATAVHTPPSGSALTITPTISAPYVNMVFGPFTVPGHHFVNVQAVGNAVVPSKPEVLYQIKVING
jgi:hypothetical protein